MTSDQADIPITDPYIVPIPIRPDMIARLQIPRDLSAEEAEKIARVVIALGQIEKEYPG